MNNTEDNEKQQNELTLEEQIVEYIVDFLISFGIDRSFVIGTLQTLKTEEQRKTLLIILVNYAKENRPLPRKELIDMTQEILRMSPTHPK